MTYIQPYSVGSGYRTSPANCDDPVHGSGPGEIVFRHMSVVQRGVRSREALFGFINQKVAQRLCALASGVEASSSMTVAKFGGRN
jgi:hypothetical protein